MTTREVVESPSTAEMLGVKIPSRWPERAVSMTGTIAQYAEYRRGDLAELRRMDPDEPDAAVFWRLMAQYGLLDVGEAMEEEMGTNHPRHRVDDAQQQRRGQSRDRTQRPNVPVGRALFLGGESQRDHWLL